MPAINPNNYNIDNLDSINLGPISVTNFRNYVLSYNLQNVEPNIASEGYSFYPRGIYIGDLWNPNQNIQDLPDLSTVAFVPSDLNNSTSPRPDNISKNLFTNVNPFYGSPTNQETFEVTEKSLQNPGSVDNWVIEGGFSTDVSFIRDNVNLNNNEYGPEFISEYGDISGGLTTTGYKQYPTSAGGDVLGPIIARTLGFSTTGAIDFPSELQTVRNERLATELKNRIIFNFVEDTAGSLNLDPLGLLAGQKTFTPNYTITRPDNFVGKAVEFTNNLIGFNTPVSIIPGGKNIKIGSNGFQDDLIQYTGKGQRDLLYANVYSSKYSPELLTKGFDPETEDKSKLLGQIGGFFDDLGKQTANNYLKMSNATEDEQKTLAQKVGTFINDLITPNSDKSLKPNTEKDTNPNDPFVTMGLDGSYSAIDGLDPNSTFNEPELNAPAYLIPGATVDYYPNKTTLKPSLFDSDDTNSSFTHTTPSTNRMFDWRDRSQPIAKRGLLKYTQDMINNAEANGHQGGAKYIGRFNSNSNIIQGQKEIGDGRTVSVPRHKDVSMGNLVRSGDDSYYCRSWSTRNPYQNHYDLIRKDKLYRMMNKEFFGNYLSVLEDTGHVKITPYSDDDFTEASNLSRVTFNPSNEIKRYMLSIENLAWMDAPEKIGLKPCELGPNGGRIMWFPPYDINFSENTSANWEATSFIGRGEPIYTYMNTDRKGTLSFTIVTDHPSVINQMKQETEDKLNKFFAGCGVDVTKFFEEEVKEVIERKNTIEVIERRKIEEEQVIPEEKPQPEQPKPKEPPFMELECFFRNARRSKTDPTTGLRVGDGRDIAIEIAAPVKYELSGSSTPTSDTKKILNLNQPFVDKLQELIDFLATKDGQSWGVEFIGYTSGAAPNNYNKVLSIDRATSVWRYVTEQIKQKGITGDSASGYTYDDSNFLTGYVGFKCVDPGDGRCLKATETSKLDINDLKIIVEPTPPSGVYTSRWVINAKGEDGATSKNDEDAIYGNNDLNAEQAKLDRKVKMVLYKNEEYDINHTIIKLEPKKASELSDLGTPLGTNDIVLTPAQIPTLAIDKNPVTDKLGTGPTVSLTETTAQAQQKALALSMLNGLNSNTPTTDASLNDKYEEVKTQKEEITKEVITKTVQKLFSECSYFEKIRKEDPFVYNGIVDKIKNFHPAFHSITPEGFNDRLTFLNQCMRQGPSIRPSTVETQNLVFGRPPVCVLRIGDFYYTKIIIDSLSISYEPLSWDMNPEGIGVQPMIAKIDLNFSFIGGSSIDGPIRQLQNAVSFNFFANTSVYNPRRYYKPDNYGETFETLVEKLKGDVTQVKTGKDYIGYGSFGSQIQADAEVTNINSVKTATDSQQQTDTVPQTPTTPPVNPYPQPTNIVLEEGSGINTESVEVGAGNTEVTGFDTSSSASNIAFNSNTFNPSGAQVFSPTNEKQIKVENPGAITPTDQINEIDKKLEIIDLSVIEGQYGTKFMRYTIKEDQRTKWIFDRSFLEIVGPCVSKTNKVNSTDKYDIGFDIGIEAESEYTYSPSGCTGVGTYKFVTNLTLLPIDSNGNLEKSDSGRTPILLSDKASYTITE